MFYFFLTFLECFFRFQFRLFMTIFAKSFLQKYQMISIDINDSLVNGTCENTSQFSM